MELDFEEAAMSISVEVGLLSGNRAFVNARLTEEVGALKLRAEVALGVRNGRLLDSSGNILDVLAPIERAGVRNGDSLTILTSAVDVCSNQRAFAAILGDRTVVAWGQAEYGGDCSAVQGQLKNVQQIQATDRAFAAILSDGSVVTWGDAGCGGASRAVQGQLQNVQQIQAAGYAFAAILGDGSVVTWSHADRGGDSSAVQAQLKNVQQIQAAGYLCFAAILGDGSFVV